MKKTLLIVLILVAVLVTLVIIGIQRNWTVDTLIGVVQCEYRLEGAAPDQKFGQADITAPKQVITGCTFTWQCERLEEAGKNFCYYTIAKERQDPTICEKITDPTKDACLEDAL